MEYSTAFIAKEITLNRFVDFWFTEQLGELINEGELCLGEQHVTANSVIKNHSSMGIRGYIANRLESGSWCSSK